MVNQHSAGAKPLLNIFHFRNSKMKITEFDTIAGYCRMLGHKVPFTYCRSMKEGLPCSKILDCWFEILPIEQFVTDHYTPEEQEKFLLPSKPKVATLIELIEKAKRSKS